MEPFPKASEQALCFPPVELLCTGGKCLLPFGSRFEPAYFFDTSGSLTRFAPLIVYCQTQIQPQATYNHMLFHHLLISGFLRGFPLEEHLQSQGTVFGVFHQKGRTREPLCGHLGSLPTKEAHTQDKPLRITLRVHVLDLFLGQQSRATLR